MYGWKTNGINTAGKLNLNTGEWSEITAKNDKTEVVFKKEADPLPLVGPAVPATPDPGTGYNYYDWKVIPGNSQQFFVRITFKDGGGNLRTMPEIPFEFNFEAGKSHVLKITLP